MRSRGSSARAPQAASRQRGGRRRVLPVVGDDAMALAEEVGEVVDVEKSGGDMPTTTASPCASHSPAASDVVGDRRRSRLRWRDLGRFALALHEEHAVELRGGCGS